MIDSAPLFVASDPLGALAVALVTSALEPIALLEMLEGVAS